MSRTFASRLFAIWSLACRTLSGRGAEPDLPVGPYRVAAGQVYAAGAAAAQLHHAGADAGQVYATGTAAGQARVG